MVELSIFPLEDKKLNARKITPSHQHNCWTDVEDIPASHNARRIADLQQMLPPIPRRQHSQTYVPPQQRPKLAPIIPGSNASDRPIHNLMGRYKEPHPPEVKCHADESTDGASAVGDTKNARRFIKTTSAYKSETTNQGREADVVIMEADKGLKYNVQASLVTKTTEVPPSASSARPVTNIRSVIQCPDGPLLPGRREPMVPHPPLEPHDARHHRNVHGHVRLEIEQDAEMNGSEGGSTTLPSIKKPKNVTCKPPSTPRINGGARKRWRNATLGQKK
ncbi:hypothetical protein ACF0H5_023928 [Mactra antiquata]